MNYYNEWDSKAADGLRELIKQGLIPQGVVDTRSINDVTANDLMGFTQCHFFAGIGGWSFALQLAGWPEDRPVWTGSCPCQSFSTAGKQRGFDDERDLWPVFANLIRECRPEYVFGEQVENAIKHGWLDRVYTDLEVENYAVGSVVLGAHSVGAPHRRQRLYWGGVSVSDAGLLGQTERQKRATGDEQCSKINSSPVSDAANNGRNDCNQGAVRTLGISKQGGLLESEGTCNCDSMADSISNAQRGLHGAGDQERTDGELNHRDGFRNDDRNSNATCSIPMSDSMADTYVQRCEEQCCRITVQQDEQWKTARARVKLRGVPGMYPWSDFKLIICRDKDKLGNHKIRRVPAESILLSVADGISGEMDECPAIGLQAAGGFPLCQTKEFAKGEIATLLKQYGNAIVPQVAAEFIKAFNVKKETEK